MQDARLMLINRDDILAVMDSAVAEQVFRLLATLSRQGYHLLATAPQPDSWPADHSSPDDALLGPNSIRNRLSDAGGVLDGVYYIRRSMLTQKRNQNDALNDILQRYAAKPSHSILLSSKRDFVDAAQLLGLTVVLLGADHELAHELTKFCEHSPDFQRT